MSAKIAYTPANQRAFSFPEHANGQMAHSLEDLVGVPLLPCRSVMKFFDHVKEDASGCWLWTGYRNRHGYGEIHRSKTKRTMAHRESYEMHCGPIPAGMVVMHRCDNPPCVNPHHLEVGTQADNCRDRVRKNRGAKGAGTGVAKLTEEQVKEIFHATGSQSEIARRFGVTQSRVSRIRAGKEWRHVTASEVRYAHGAENV